VVGVLELVTKSDESATCRNCGAHLTEDFRRVFGDEDHVTDPEDSAAHYRNDQAVGGRHESDGARQ